MRIGSWHSCASVQIVPSGHSSPSLSQRMAHTPEMHSDAWQSMSLRHAEPTPAPGSVFTNAWHDPNAGNAASASKASRARRILETPHQAGAARHHAHAYV